MTNTETAPARVVLTINQFAQRHPSFTPGALRNLIWRAGARRSSLGVIPGNGLAKAIIKLGRRVYIDESAFFDWLSSHRVEAADHAA